MSTIYCSLIRSNIQNIVERHQQILGTSVRARLQRTPSKPQKYYEIRAVQEHGSVEGEGRNYENYVFCVWNYPIFIP